MSYIFNNAVKYSDSTNLDAFGRLRVSEITSLLETTHVNSDGLLFEDEATTGTTTSIWDQPNAQIIMSATGTSYIIRQTFRKAPYQPGKSQLFEASFSNFEIQEDVIKRVGAFTTSTSSLDEYDTDYDGFFLESNGITNEISFQVWKTGDLSFSASTTSWDSNQIDPLSIDWSLTNLIFVDFQWLGVGRIRFGMVIEGVLYFFSQNWGVNNLTNVYMSSPNKPIRYEIRTYGDTGQFNKICSQLSQEGSINTLNIPVSVLRTSSVSLASSGTKYPVIGYRINPNYPNISPELLGVGILTTTNDDYILTLEKNPIITGGSYSYSASTNDAIQYMITDGTPTVSSSGLIMTSFYGEGNSSNSTTFTLKDSELKPGIAIDGTPDEVWVCITPLSNSLGIYGSLNIEYHK
jgi:hypothetical protein